MSRGKLPEGWVETQLGNIIELKYGKSLAARTRDGFGFPVYGSNGVVGKHSIPLINKSGLIVGRKGSYGVVNKSVGPFFPIDTTYYIDDFYNQPLEFLFYYLSFLPLTKLNRSTAIPGLNRDDAYDLNIALPPLAEQKIIAEKLDTLLAQVDSTKARLEQIPQILKRFRQAVLAAAASGRLTNKWRENYTQKEKINLIASKYKPTDSLFKQAKLSLPEIPQSWYVVPSAHLIGYVTSGSRGWANYYSTEGALFLRMSNVRYNTTKLDLQDLQFVNLPNQVEGKRSLVQIDDLIISLTADVGRVARIDKDLGEAYINQHLALLRPNNNINSEFFALCIAAQNIGVKQIQSLKRGATKVGLGLDDIRSLAIPLPSLPEQAEIVRRVEQLFAYADTIEKQVNNALTRVNSLTQSILAKAFRGELTAQWRAENPDLISGENSAAALLEKIKAERAASGGKKTSRKKA
ncbi:restriction endonuclease subunit S [Salmonella enterica]|nr:restriction endonuclease subunit S [Salmonella enterica subsp. enterica serovar Jodhpur]EDT7399374.1 restriction endonuclease subunit S [Salmonella enterica subsp. enterica]EEL1217387.1 restriction endonuclease subunit S [Salmonella enterica]EGJ2478536.1 restriction endonuclease subunit S [Salmonella enterica]EHU0477435.1 restriction endonuclease subunit S [Salmonella enterica]